MNKVFIVGNKGNMGRRYESILRSIGVDVFGIDDEHEKPSAPVDEADGIIIASPSKCHKSHVYKYSNYKKPMLCEKPIAFSSEDIDQMDRCLGRRLERLTMVNQYYYLCNTASMGDTVYDYYNTGKDGLAWDCINIIGLANGECVLDNKSPVWYCKINGTKISIEDMDKAYIAMIKNWINRPTSNFAYIRQAHRKVEKWLTSS